MLHRVLRTPNISERSVTISGTTSPAGETEPPDLEAEQTGDRAESADGDEAFGVDASADAEGREGDSPESEVADAEAGEKPPGPYEFVGPLPEGESWPEDPEDHLVGVEDARAAAGGEPGSAEETLPGESAEPESPGLAPLDVERQVEERLAEFEERFQREKEDAYRAGFEDGKSEGTKEGLQQSADEVERLAAIVDSLHAQWENVTKGHDVQLAELAVAVARRIVGASVDVDREVVVRTVHDSLGYLTDKSRVVIRVHPDDLAIVREHRRQWLESLESLEQLVIEGSTAISPGGCVIESPVGDVDAQIEERLERMRVALVEAVGASETASAVEASDAPHAGETFRVPEREASGVSETGGAPEPEAEGTAGGEADVEDADLETKEDAPVGGRESEVRSESREDADEKGDGEAATDPSTDDSNPPPDAV